MHYPQRMVQRRRNSFPATRKYQPQQQRLLVSTLTLRGWRRRRTTYYHYSDVVVCLRFGTGLLESSMRCFVQSIEFIWEGLTSKQKSPHLLDLNPQLEYSRPVARLRSWLTEEPTPLEDTLTQEVKGEAFQVVEALAVNQ